MGWRTDWLYRLIFKEVETIWSGAVRNGEGAFGPPPDYLVVRECAGAAWEDPECAPPIIREWTYSGGEFESRVPQKADSAPVVQRGMFWSVGWVSFHIRPDRKKVVITFVVGPRYGRGSVYRAWGQGKRGGLELDPDSNSGIS